MKKKMLSERQLEVLKILANTKYPIYKSNIAEEIYGDAKGTKRLGTTFKILQEGGYIVWGYDSKLDRNGWIISFKGREYLKTCKPG